MEAVYWPVGRFHFWRDWHKTGKDHGQCTIMFQRRSFTTVGNLQVFIKKYFLIEVYEKKIIFLIATPNFSFRCKYYSDFKNVILI